MNSIPLGTEVRLCGINIIPLGEDSIPYSIKTRPEGIRLRPRGIKSRRYDKANKT